MHTTEEFSKVLAALFEEQKKVQALEQRLKTAEEKQTTDEGSEKLKSMFLTLKKKYAQALHALNEKEKKCHDFERLTKQLELVKASAAQLQKKSDLSDEECLSLREQQETLKNLLQEAQTHTTKLQKELDSALQRLQASEYLQSELDSERQKFKILKEEFDLLKVQASASQMRADELSQMLNGDAQVSLGKLQQENEKLVEQATDSSRRSEQLDRVIAFLRERLQESQLELEQVKQEYGTAVSAKELLQQQADELQTSVEELNKTLTKEKTEKEQLLGQVSETRNQLELAQQNLDLLQQQVTHTAQTEQELAAWRSKFDLLALEKQNLSKELLDLQSEKDENDARIKIAQQHLAKKVKETALLTEKLEEQKIQLNQLHNQYESAKNKISEMQLNLEMQTQQEKRIEENLLDSLKSSEIQTRRWEEKYFQMCDKWQECEAQNKELKQLEEKFHQMQTLIMSFNNILGATSFAPPVLLQKNSCQVLEAKDKTPEHPYFD